MHFNAEETKRKNIGALCQTETIFSASIESIIKNERGERLHFEHAHTSTLALASFRILPSLALHYMHFFRLP